MYPSNPQNHVRIQQYPQPPQVSAPINSKSPLLIGLGITEIVISNLLFFWCIWAAAISLYVAYFGFVCALFHIMVGVFAVIGGRDGIRFKKCIVALLILSIVGSCVFVTITISALGINWDQTTYDCHECRHRMREEIEDNSVRKYHEYNIPSYCPEACELSDSSLVFVPILMFILIESIVGIILSSISCCRLCRCCGCYYGGDTDAPNMAFQVFAPAQTPYYHLREDDIQHSVPPNMTFQSNQQNII